MFPKKAHGLHRARRGEGPALGEALRAEEAWIAQDLPMEPERIAKIADTAEAPRREQ